MEKEEKSYSLLKRALFFSQTYLLRPPLLLSHPAHDVSGKKKKRSPQQKSHQPRKADV